MKNILNKKGYECKWTWDTHQLHSWQEQVIFRWENNDVCFVPDQHWNKSVGRHVAPLGYIILIPSQPVFTLW
jgi:hypothetical protein